ncbi:PREDICTED: uncharacterized protein LOC108767945, partial [Trachymyrmex cornetzi]|uniref:uncharacterized protein LOC108767945 n=1 Tax=Trachymyrmex cornetzi TaxID=471704 RepID=UPI00084ED48C
QSNDLSTSSVNEDNSCRDNSCIFESLCEHDIEERLSIISSGNYSATDDEDNKNEFLNDDNEDLRSIASVNSEHIDIDDTFILPETDDIIMFEASGIRMSDVKTMIAAYSIRFSISDVAQTALVHLVRTLAGPSFKHWNCNIYEVQQAYDPPSDMITYNYFCTTCHATLLPPISKKQFKNVVKFCPKCKQQHNLTINSLNYYLSVDLESQIKTLLHDKKVRQTLLHNLKKIENSYQSNRPHYIRDVYDSTIYAKLKSRTKSDDSHMLTYNFNTDGAPIFISSKKSMWPLQIIINELPVKMRFRNILLGAFWVGEVEPTPAMMNAFLKEFVVQAKHLQLHGVRIGTEIFRFYPFCCTVDSVARPIIQNRIQFNGYYGCSWCYTQGKYSHKAIRYPLTKEDELRCHSSHLQDVVDATKLGKAVRGVKGSTILLQLEYFDFVWGFPIDYMHGDLLGVTRQMLDIWTTPNSPVYINPKILKIIDNNLVHITPVKEIHRMPRSVSQRSKWKASEWRSWLLFYCLPCLQGHVPEKIMHHMALLVKSIFTLLKELITENELKE